MRSQKLWLMRWILLHREQDLRHKLVGHFSFCELCAEEESPCPVATRLLDAYQLEAVRLLQTFGHDLPHEDYHDRLSA